MKQLQQTTNKEFSNCIDTPGCLVKKEASYSTTTNNGFSAKKNYFVANKVKFKENDQNVELINLRENSLISRSKNRLSQNNHNSFVDQSLNKHNLNTTILNQPTNNRNTILDNFNSPYRLIMSKSSANPTSDRNKIHLFVKAGVDGRSQGACPFCQDVFMQLLIKAENNKFNFDVITINLDNPPSEFKELSIKPPVLIHGTSALLGELSEGDDRPNAVILSDVDEIAEYLDALYPNPKLTVSNSEANKVCLNVYSKFSFFIRSVASQSTNLESELEKIDNYLRDNTDEENKFLNGKYMSHLDCSLLPKLQHIRVAAEHLKKFKMPYRFKHLWRYLGNAYETDAFEKSSPPNREIISFWMKSNVVSKKQLQIMQEAPSKTLTLPDDLRI